ncbi:ATP-binding protein [Paracoccus denitrificans]|jgi:signal transduction histidine kinase/purine-cytosine permease-like protein|uniref:histidine kinase n=1 Tax=Paracoccus denitrificans (strain Pd 1222) TaxID=318586 RepID=A1B7Z2_PARDP|nr:ATP-binding protein [Paracoccus denitrificans]ABL71636.1 integral membrane sensor signal transduction histidine kinase [Paracoccus denitrificans PD1222]MBB4629782.1 signal transduction histidine kinase/purine-cytosine permease-like protein [Paracoccus denitrificans]MCU7431218.1 ATP-binding protein [Paracoccus denitrificans]UPV97964.1 ATP-binding protein [Paracoccus denitrificans]WQO35882.1 ATP-binding protein [Paracoccus denitrificans]
MNRHSAIEGADLPPRDETGFPGLEPTPRSYQSWVADETIEDYALRYAPASHRRWSPTTITHTALGGISFLALEAIGAALTISWGVHVTVVAVLIASVFIFVTSLPIAYHVARANVDMDLLTRGAGFGYIGSAITSLIYATYTIIFFALEGVIIGQALLVCFGLPLPLGYLLSALAILPVASRGMTAISRFQVATQLPWIVLALLPFAAIAWAEPDAAARWLAAPGPAFGLLSLGGAIGVLCALTLQIGEQVDYLRFLPPREAVTRLRWWGALILAGPGWILIGGTKILMGSFLVWLAIGDGMAPEFAVEPIGMFWHAYEYLFGPRTALLVATVYILVAQVKINVTNAYAGSLAQSNFFLRVARYHPGRLIWLLIHVAISCALMLMGVFATLEAVLAIYANLALAWLGAIFADLAVLKPLRLSPARIEFRRAYLPDFNLVGCGGMALGALAGLALYAGLGGPIAQAWSAPIAFALSLIAATGLGLMRHGRGFIAREPHVFRRRSRCDCAICSHGYETRDMAYCTFYERPICSLCCSLEPHCRDFCKRSRTPGAVDPAGAPALRLHRMPPRLGRRAWQVAAMFAVLMAGLGMLYLIARHLSASLRAMQVVAHVFLGSAPPLALLAFWAVMANERRRLTEEDLIDALRRLGSTQRELAIRQRLAAVGEVAATISHELRNPLGTITSSVEVLSRSPGLGPDAEEDVQRIRRNIARCSRIIDILLDFARQGAHETVPVDLRDWLSGLVAEHPAGAHVVLEVPAGMRLRCDPARLQFAIRNLIENGWQAAESVPGREPRVILRAFRDGHRSIIEIEDNGPGLPPEIRARAFDPLVTTKASGVGLGLSLVRRVAELHGGDAWIERTGPEGTVMRLSVAAQP